jgi:hypothetical protein
MRKLFTFLTLFICAFHVQSQNITIDELVSLRKQSFGNVEEVLSKKNWTFLNGSEPNLEKMGSATFAFNKREFNDNADSFFEFLYDNTENEELCNHKINIQFFDKNKYSNYINRFKSLGCKLIKSKIENGNIVKIYQGSTTTFQISIIAEKDGLGTTITRYQLFIMGNVDYFIFFDDDTTLRDLLDERIENENNLKSN